VIAGLSIAGIEANYQGETIHTFAKKVIHAADAISTKLGYIQK